MKKNAAVLAFILAGLMLQAGCEPQAGDSQVRRSLLESRADVRDIASDLERTLPGLMDELGVPGLSIALIHDGAVAWLGAFGVTKAGTDQSVTDKTVFEAASLSKPVFAYLILKLVSRGVFELDRPLHEYASDEEIRTRFLGPDFDDARFLKVTARMVLNHSTGFPNWRAGNTIEIGFEPGARFRYSAEGFYCLQVLAEMLTRRRFTDLVQEEVFDPLGMSNSSFLWRPEFENVSADRHDMMGEPRGLRRHSRALGPATLMTTSTDYARFLAALMIGEGLTPEVRREMLGLQSTYGREGFDGVDWGLGTGLERWKGETGIWHWGDNTYAQAFFLAFPERKAGFVYFANSFYGLALAADIVDAVCGGEHPVVSCGIMRPYVRAGRPISEFIRKLRDGDLGQALEIFKKHIQAHIENYNETLLEDIGRWLLERGRLDAALVAFKLNVESYPDSWTVFDSLGDAYLKNDEKDLAVLNYKRSLELNPENAEAKKIVERFEKR